MVERWQKQTANERWHLANESAKVIIDGIVTFGSKFLMKK